MRQTQSPVPAVRDFIRVYQGLKLPLQTAIVLAGDPSRATLALELKQDLRFNVVGEFASLGESYSDIEAHSPDITICHKSLSNLPEFHMFAAMLRMVGSTLITVESDADVRTVARTLGLPSQPASVPDTKPMLSTSHSEPAVQAGRLNGVPQRLVAIGASTGGIEALEKVLATYPSLCPPTVVVQHIKADYLASVVQRLDRICPAKVMAATPNLPLRPGQVVFAPGQPLHLEVQPRSLRCVLIDKPQVSGHRPSVDVLFRSVASMKSKAVGVILTGMGRDGAAGLAAMRQAGAWTIAQDAATSTVYGMPRVAAEQGAARQILPLHKITNAILAAASAQEETSR